MTYRISGLDPAPYRSFFNLPDALLADRGIVRMSVDRKPCFPCRVSLADREIGESVLLVNHVSNDVSNPYRASHAIFVGEGADRAEFVDELPPVFAGRTLSLRAFDEVGMMVEAILSKGSDADCAIRKLLGRREVETIHTHNAARGCFLAKIERS